MEEYQIKVIDNHLIIFIGQHKVLIDSGSPTSVGNIQQIKILNNTFQISQQYMGLTIEQLIAYVDPEIDLLLGGDILSRFNYKIDLLNKIISFSEEAIVLDNCFELPLSFYKNIPIIEYEVNGESIRAFFDTGAKISYINSNIANNFNRVGEIEDFYPGQGTFEVDLYEIPILINNAEHILRFGTLPAQLQMALMMGGTQSILGTELLKNYIILISPNLNEFYCQEY